MSHLPPEVARLTLAVYAIPGVSSVDVAKAYLPDIALSNLSLLGFFADLPAAAIRRTEGALPGELLISINFTISRDEKGLRALEFLAWWARDHARSGENIQLRAIALPPIAGTNVQLGETLKFTIDWFYINKSESVAEVMAEIERLAISLEKEVEEARSAF
jgi:hypothetical protein